MDLLNPALTAVAVVIAAYTYSAERRATAVAEKAEARAEKAEARAERAESIAQLLGEKETVAFAALKLFRRGLPTEEDDRAMVLDAVMQACVFTNSSRARALLYRVIEENRAAFGGEIAKAVETISETFSKMRSYGFSKKEFDPATGEARIELVNKVAGLS